MKNILFSFFFFTIVINTFALDELTFHNGSVVQGYVVVNETAYIKFVYDGEKAETTIGKAALKEVKYESGRIEVFSSKVNIENVKKDYDDVLVFWDKEDITGLTRIKEINAKSGGEFSISSSEGRYTKKTIAKLKKQAAKLGGCAILIISEKGNSASFFKDAHSSMTAIVYKY